MNTVIFRTISPFLTALIVIFSVFVLLRGHNEPGGGFIGGLIAVSAIAIYGLSNGAEAAKRVMYLSPIQISGVGLALSAFAGFFSIPAAKPYLTGIWIFPEILGTEVKLSTILIFDIGVYLVVVGAFSAIALALEEGN
jgi:multicomponent Na+:H+ antiporter subunit B